MGDQLKIKMRRSMRATRRVRNLSKEELADMMGVSIDTLEGWESRTDRDPPMAKYVEMALRLDAPEMVQVLVEEKGWVVRRRRDHLREEVRKLAQRILDITE